MRPSSRLTAGALAFFTLLACKMFKKEEPAPSALPPPEPPPTATAAATATTEPSAEPAKDSPTPTNVTTKKGDAGAKDGGATDASASTDSGAAASDAGKADAGGKGAACAAKCQSILQACLSPGLTEAGAPKLPDPHKCQAAFDDCAKACK